MSNTTFDTARQYLRRNIKRTALAALLAGGVMAASLGAMAHGSGMAMGFHHGSMSAEDVTAHIDKFLQHVYIELDATDTQKAKLDPIVKQAVTDLMAFRPQAQNFHSEVLAVLTQDKIDRVAIETLRAQHMQTADQASRRIAQLIGDVGDVLTPAQRKALAARIAEHHGISAD